MNCLAFLFTLLITFLVTLSAQRPERCGLPLKTGVCKALLYRYGFSTHSNKCILFKYGGCGSNGNNFRTLKECEQACPAKERRAVYSCHPDSPDFNREKCWGTTRTPVTRVTFPNCYKFPELCQSCHPDSPNFNRERCWGTTKVPVTKQNYSCHPDSPNFNREKCWGTTAAPGTKPNYSCHPDSPNFNREKCWGPTQAPVIRTTYANCYKFPELCRSCHPDSPNYDPLRICGLGKK